jgi:hypothetical protein
VLEVAIAVLVFLYLLLLALPGIEWQVAIGVIATLIGLVGGGGAGIVYHLALRRTLLRLNQSTRGWLWSPVSRHVALDDTAQREVLPWFRAGAAGFFVCLAGIGLVTVAVLRAAFAN